MGADGQKGCTDKKVQTHNPVDIEGDLHLIIQDCHTNTYPPIHNSFLYLHHSSKLEPGPTVVS